MNNLITHKWTLSQTEPCRKIAGQEHRRIRRVTTKGGDDLYVVEHQFHDGAAWSFMHYRNPITGLDNVAIFSDNKTAEKFMINPEIFEVAENAITNYWQGPYPVSTVIDPQLKRGKVLHQ